jgi:hypothetical protein
MGPACAGLELTAAAADKASATARQCTFRTMFSLHLLPELLRDGHFRRSADQSFLP